MTGTGSPPGSGFAGRVLTSFLGTSLQRKDGYRERAGYGFGRRVLASFLRVDLASRTPDVPTEAGTVTPVAVRRPGSPWFALPALRAATQGTVLAASGERIAAVRSPDGAVEFSVYQETDEPEPVYALEVVLRAVVALPALVRIAYDAEREVRRFELILPLAAAPIGPPTSRVRLPGFSAGHAWESAGLITREAAVGLGAPVIEASIAAAATAATIEAWQRVRAGGDALADLVEGSWGERGKHFPPHR